YWHRPLVAYRDASGEAAVLPDAPLGYLTAYDADRPRLDRPVELWPRMQRRPVLLAALAGEDYTRKRQVPPQVRNVRKLTQTYAHTARRSFEVAYWKTIASLAETPLLNKNNADSVLDEASQRVTPYRERHLDRLADLLLPYHRKKIAAAKMTGKALAGDVPFR